MSINRNSPVPLHHQLKLLLAERISSGDLQPGDMVPTEEQLQDQYELSRTTVRQALKTLEVEGAITRFRGRGTFVAKPKLTHSPEPRFSLSDYLRDQGIEPGWRILSAEWCGAPPEAAAPLGIAEASLVFCLRRLRLANDEPIGYHTAYVPNRFRDDIDMAALETGGSLRYLRGGNHLEGSLADRTLEAVAADDDHARLLDVEKGSPLLLIRRLVVSAEGVPIEYFRGAYRGDSFEYHIRHLPAVNPINA